MIRTYLYDIIVSLTVMCVCTCMYVSKRKSKKNPNLFYCLCSAAQNVTVEEILSSYKQACQKLNCKPIPKVLKQIQVSPIVTETH